MSDELLDEIAEIESLDVVFECLQGTEHYVESTHFFEGNEKSDYAEWADKITVIMPAWKVEFELGWEGEFEGDSTAKFESHAFYGNTLDFIQWLKKSYPTIAEDIDLTEFE